MLATSQTSVRNRILSRLAEPEYRQLQPGLERVALRARDVLCAPGDHVEHLYFPNDAVVSMLFEVDASRLVEVAMEGNEGVVGLAVHLGGNGSPNYSTVREAGTAMRVAVDILPALTNGCADLHALLDKSVYAFAMQIALAGICGRFHTVDARLARWLLMTQDRLGSRELHATQESIAHMLGVRRSSVTVAASGFHKREVIAYRRGRIQIRDRRQLRAASCSCYGIIKHQYDSFLN